MFCRFNADYTLKNWVAKVARLNALISALYRKLTRRQNGRVVDNHVIWLTMSSYRP
jgi:hypothetical protein